jgi:DNA polymerase-3 subunit beta
MNLSIARRELDHAASVVANLVERSGPQPVLGNVLINANEGTIQLRGADNESFVVVNLAGTIHTPGRTTVPAEMFRDIVRLMPPQGEVSIVENAQRVRLSCESNEYKLTTIPADEFPEWNNIAETTRFQIPQKSLKYLIDSTTYALPAKDHRRVLMGVYFELTGNRLRLTSTDGKKLARVHVDIPEVEGVSEARMIVPRKLLDNLFKALGNEGPVEIELAGSQIGFRFGGTYFRGNCIDGKYPDCDAVIPKDFPIKIPLNKDVFQASVRRAGITTDDKNRPLVLKFADNSCHFSSMALNIGMFNGRTPIDYVGPTMELAFNVQYLIETLGRFTKPEITLFIKSSTAPVAFRGKDEDDRLRLLMPLKLSEVISGADDGLDE